MGVLKSLTLCFPKEGRFHLTSVTLPKGKYGHIHCFFRRNRTLVPTWRESLGSGYQIIGIPRHSIVVIPQNFAADFFWFFWLPSWVTIHPAFGVLPRDALMSGYSSPHFRNCPSPLQFHLINQDTQYTRWGVGPCIGYSFIGNFRQLFCCQSIHKRLRFVHMWVTLEGRRHLGFHIGTAGRRCGRCIQEVRDWRTWYARTKKYITTRAEQSHHRPNSTIYNYYFSLPPSQSTRPKLWKIITPAFATQWILSVKLRPGYATTASKLVWLNGNNLVGTVSVRDNLMMPPPALHPQLRLNIKSPTPLLVNVNEVFCLFWSNLAP